jgi:hypothetical protein
MKASTPYWLATGLMATGTLLAGVGIGSVIPGPERTPEACITALDRQEQAVEMLAGPRTPGLADRVAINQSLVKSASDKCRGLADGS